MRSHRDTKLKRGSPAGRFLPERLRASVVGDVRKGVFASIVLSTVWFSLFTAHSANAEPTSSEYAVKVAFIFNFLKFIQWPVGAFRDASEPVSVCVKEKSDLDGPIETLQGKTVQDRSVQVRRITGGDPQGRCNVVYFGAQPAGAGDLAQKYTVTIGDAPHFANAGGIVNFFREGERLRFEINIEAARQADVQFSADMLRLARIIDRERTQ